MAFGYAIYFCERPKNRVLRWEPDTDRVTLVAGDPKTSDRTQFLRDPYGLAFDSGGSLLISDKLHNRICRLVGGRLEPVGLRDVYGRRALPPGSTLRFDPEVLRSPSTLYASTWGGILCTFFDDHTLYRIGPRGELNLILGVVRNQDYVHESPRESIPPHQATSVPIGNPTAVVERSDGTLFFIERMTQIVRMYHPGRELRSIFPFCQMGNSKRQPDAPAGGPINSYHPPFPCSLALDKANVLHLCDSLHRSVLAIDVEKGTFRRCVLVDRPTGPAFRGTGPVAVAFGPDGTAWLANSASASIEGYKVSRDGRWTLGRKALKTIEGNPLNLGTGGMGILASAF